MIFCQSKQKLNIKLLEAVKVCDISEAESLIKKGADVNTVDTANATLFMWAIYRCNIEMVKLLYKNGADPNKKGIIYNSETSTYGSSLIVAAGEGKLTILKYLIEECKVDINDTEKGSDGHSGWSALQTASFNGKRNIIEYLLDKGANINYQCYGDSSTALTLALISENTAVASSLILHGADTDIKDSSGFNALHMAAYFGYFDIVQLLIDKGANLNAQTKQGITPLIYATLGGDFFICYILWQKGANINIRDNLNRTALDWAILDNKEPIVAFLSDPLNNQYVSNGLVPFSTGLSKRPIDDEVPTNKAIREIDDLEKKCVISYNQGDFEGSINYGMQALNKTEMKLGKKCARYAEILNQLGMTQVEIGIYSQAEKFYLQSLEIRKTILGDTNAKYINTLCNIGNLYQEMEEFEKAEVFLIKAKDLCGRFLGKRSMDYAHSLDNLAGLYLNIGQYKKAEALFNEALGIIKQNGKDDEITFALLLCNLATVKSNLKDYKAADSLYCQSLDLIKLLLGEDHPYYATVLNSSGVANWTQGNMVRADTMFTHAYNIFKTKDTLDPSIIIVLSNLACLYREMDQYEMAEILYKKALNAKERLWSTKHSSYLTTLDHLGLLYFRMKRFAEADSIFSKAMLLIRDQISNIFSFTTEKEKEIYYETVDHQFDIYQSFYFYWNRFNLQKSSPEFFEITITQKEIILMSTQNLRHAIKQNHNDSVQFIFARFLDIKEKLSYYYSKMNGNQDSIGSIIDNLEINAEALEKEMVKVSKEVKEEKKTREITLKDIQKNLNPGEYAIEFCNFHLNNGKNWTDSVIYCASLLKPGIESPEMVFLFEEKQLDSLLLNVLGDDAQKTGQLYASRGTIIEGTKQWPYLASTLYDLIWKPIEPYLKGVNTIYFSPSGLLHKISFAAIATPDSIYLSDKYKLVQLGSTREIVKLKKQNDYITLSDSALIYGGINYEQMDVVPDSSKNDLLAYRSLAIPNDSSRGTTWVYLKGTMSETKYIDSLFRNNKVATAFYSNDKATETIFKNISGRAPQIMHISTHGFFFPEPEEKRDKNTFMGFGEQTYHFSENPMLRSGLILAGANYIWEGGEQTPGKNDGILTAYEVSNMDLSKTKLVVLSACETGLGDIKGSEGVFGLQRAFKMAGVDYIIMSLWQVPDTETKDFMQQFYTNCFNRQAIREAFTNAQNWMKHKFPNDPYKWAAFVLME